LRIVYTSLTGLMAACSTDPTCATTARTPADDETLASGLSVDDLSESLAGPRQVTYADLVGDHHVLQLAATRTGDATLTDTAKASSPGECTETLTLPIELAIHETAGQVAILATGTAVNRSDDPATTTVEATFDPAGVPLPGANDAVHGSLTLTWTAIDISGALWVTTADDVDVAILAGPVAP
jgi:hypothetical protein